MTLKELRLREQMSQKELADALDVSQSAVCLYENGKRRLPVEKAKKLEDRFTVPWYLLYNSDGTVN